MADSYYESGDFKLYNADSLNFLDELPDCFVDMIFADPPYFLSNDGVTCQSGQMVSVNKGDWDKSEGFANDYDFTKSWIQKCRRVLKPQGTIWISGTQHIIFKVGTILEELGFKLMNDIIWFKPNASPNLACRYFTHSHETIIWAKKDPDAKHIFNYEVMKNWDVSNDNINNQGKQMRSVWGIPLTPQKEKTNGHHPTQKPMELLMRIVQSSTNEGDLVLDPFNGSGTTGIVAEKLNRKYIGVDLEKEYLDLTIKRHKEIVQEKNSLKKVRKLTDFLDNQ
jgi:site-specific DNA-methyltransferase (adenine-specific)